MTGDEKKKTHNLEKLYHIQGRLCHLSTILLKKPSFV